MILRLEEVTTTSGSQKNGRRHFIGGSDARVIMSPDEPALIRLWKEKRGEVEPEDLSDNLVVQLGLATEALNRSWYERDRARAIILLCRVVLFRRLSKANARATSVFGDENYPRRF